MSLVAAAGREMWRLVAAVQEVFLGGGGCCGGSEEREKKWGEREKEMGSQKGILGRGNEKERLLRAAAGVVMVVKTQKLEEEKKNEGRERGLLLTRMDGLPFTAGGGSVGWY